MCNIYLEVIYLDMVCRINFYFVAENIKVHAHSVAYLVSFRMHSVI